MKIKKSELVQIIKEEAVKVKKVKLLEAEKTELLNQLNEMYEGEMDENMLKWLQPKKEQELSRDEAINVINSHGGRKKVLQSLQANQPEKAEKYIEFFQTHKVKPNDLITWNPVGGAFTVKGGSIGLEEGEEKAE